MTDLATGIPCISGARLRDVNPVLRERYLLGLSPVVQSTARELHGVMDRLILEEKMPPLDFDPVEGGEHIHHHFQEGRILLELPGWVELHMGGTWEEYVPKAEDRVRTLRSLQARGDVVRGLLQKLPPSCVVTAVQPCFMPGFAGIGVVSGYLDGGGVVVTPFPGAQFRVVAPPDSLQVIGCWKGWTPERVASALQEKLD